MRRKKAPKVKKKIRVQKPSKFKVLRLKYRRWQEEEQEEKERKKRDINYSIKPKGFFARKIGVISFWLVFSFMFLVVAVTLFSNNQKVTADEEISFEINKATTPEAILFAGNFLRDYFTWTVDENGQEKRKETMKKYVSEELRNHPALDVKDLNWNSSFIKAELKTVTEKGKNMAYVTYLVDFEFTEVLPSQPVTTVEETDEESEENVEDGEEKEEIKQEPPKKPKVKRLQKYVEVPIAYDGYSYGVYELPKFTYINENETTVKKVQIKDKLEQADLETANKAREFLPTFFKTYAEDEKEKLDYMLKGFVTDGLNGTMNFGNIHTFQVYKGNAENEFMIFTEVTFIEPETEMPFIMNYQLDVVLEDNRLLVTAMNNQTNKEVITNRTDVSVEVNQNDEGQQDNNEQ